VFGTNSEGNSLSVQERINLLDDLAAAGDIDMAKVVTTTTTTTTTTTYYYYYYHVNRLNLECNDSLT